MIRAQVQPNSDNPLDTPTNSDTSNKVDPVLLRLAEQQRSDSGVLYYGIDKGSDEELQAIQQGASGINPYFQKHAGPMKGYYNKQGLYKVGYLNSKKFAKELLGKNPEVIKGIQSFMESVGLISKYQPGELDKATRAAFKELLTRANQRGTTWQKALGDAVKEGGMFDPSKEQERDPFRAILTDPVTLRETFQAVAQSLYGGDLPDAEIETMVNSFRAQQEAKQHANYDAEGTTTTVDNPESLDPKTYAFAQIKGAHPNEVGAEEFGNKMQTLLDAFTKPVVSGT